MILVFREEGWFRFVFLFCVEYGVRVSMIFVFGFGYLLFISVLIVVGFFLKSDFIFFLSIEFFFFNLIM